MRGREIAFSFSALLLSSFAAAQGVKPLAVPDDQPIHSMLSAEAARLPDGTPYNCYSINTRAGDEVTVTLRSKAFDSSLQVARGALCSASALQFDNDNFESQSRDARVRFTAAGGRYLVLAGAAGPEAKGDYTLQITSDDNAASSVASTTESGPLASESTHVEQVIAVNAESKVEIDRRALMQQQVTAYRAERAAEEARRQALEAERRIAEEARQEQERQAKTEREQRNAQMWSAVMTGLNQVATEYSAEQSRIAERNARYAEVTAAAERQRAAEAEAERAALLARQAQEAHEVAAYRAMQQREAQQRAAAQQAARDKAAAAARPTTVAAASPAPAFSATRNTGAASNAARSATSSKLVATPEAIVACTKPNEAGRFECDTPVEANQIGGPKSGLMGRSTPESFIGTADSCPMPRRLLSTTHIVWGCGVGATGNSTTKDRSAGVDVQGRQTFYCYPLETNCRKTSP